MNKEVGIYFSGSSWSKDPAAQYLLLQLEYSATFKSTCFVQAVVVRICFKECDYSYREQELFGPQNKSSVRTPARYGMERRSRRGLMGFLWSSV